MDVEVGGSVYKTEDIDLWRKDSYVNLIHKGVGVIVIRFVSVGIEGEIFDIVDFKIVSSVVSEIEKHAIL